MTNEQRALRAMRKCYSTPSQKPKTNKYGYLAIDALIWINPFLYDIIVAVTYSTQIAPLNSADDAVYRQVDGARVICVRVSVIYYRVSAI